MRWTTKLRYGLARMLVKSAGYTMIPSWVRSTFLIPTFDRLVSEGYNKSAVVAACISVLTFTFSEPPLCVWSEEGTDGQLLPDHPLRQLLRKPNALMGEDELWQYTVAYAAIGGNAYWVCTLDARGMPAELGLWPYHAGQVRPIPGGPAWITGYEFFSADGQWEKINQNKYSVVHFKWPLPDPMQPWIAQPPLRAVSSSVDTQGEIDTYVLSLLKNNAIPPLVITLPPGGAMPKPEKDRFRDQWLATYANDRSGAPAILDDGMTIERLGLDVQQLAYDALNRVPEARIASAFRIPPIIAGLLIGLEMSTYSNYEQARKAFTQDTLVPLWRAWAAEVESTLGTAFGVYLRHDLTEVASLQEDVNNKWTRVIRAHVSGLLAFDEARKALGYEKPAPNDLFVTRPQMALAFADVIMNPVEKPAIDITPSPSPSLPLPAAAEPDAVDEEPPEDTTLSPPPKARKKPAKKDALDDLIADELDDALLLARQAVDA
jgi:HK97 family phage portal protein